MVNRPAAVCGYITYISSQKSNVRSYTHSREVDVSGETGSRTQGELVVQRAVCV